MRATTLLPIVLATAASMHAVGAPEGARLMPDLRIREFALCPDGQSVVVRSDAKVLLVGWPDGKELAPAPMTGPAAELPPCAATALGFSSDGHLYAQTARDGSITIRDVATGGTRKTLIGHLGTIGAVAFSPDGKWLASGGFDNDLRIWDVAAGTCARTLTSPSHATFTIVWAPDGRTFYTAGASRTVTAWGAANGERLRESASLGKPINNLALSTDGRRLVAGTFAAEGFNLPADIRILDAATFAEQRVIPSPDGGAVGLAITADGSQLLWASSAGRGIAVTSLQK